MLASDVYVNDNWVELANTTGTPGVIDNGDFVDNSNDPGAIQHTALIGFNAFTSIQAAIDAVDVGGRVHILAGTYSENTTITGKDVDLLGETSGAGVRPEWRTAARAVATCSQSMAAVSAAITW